MDDQLINQISNIDIDMFSCQEEANNLESRLISDAKNVSKSIETQASNLKNAMLLYLNKLLIVYSRDSLIIALMKLKESARLKITFEKAEYYRLTYEGVLNLLDIVVQIDNKKFENLELRSCKNLTIALLLIRSYTILVDNIDHSSYSNTRAFTLNNYLEPGYFYSAKFDKYMDDFFKILDVEYPEDTPIESEIVQSSLKSKGVDKESIIRNLYRIISRYFGFQSDDLIKFTRWGLKKDSPNFIVYMDKISYSQKVGLPLEVVNSIVKTFSINSVAEKYVELNQKLEITKILELKSIYEIDNKIIIFPFDLFQNISCFEKFFLKRHFIEYYTSCLESTAIEMLKPELDHIEGDISTYVAYVLVDKLYNSGYKLPIKNGIPYSEITSIVINNQNILKNSGDIDVLALCEKKKTIYNIEIKYYKPILKLKEISSEYKCKERKKNIILPLKRQKILSENVNNVVKFLGCMPNGEYKVQTIFVTPRPDYFFENWKSSKFEYYTWEKIIRLIENQSF